MAYHSGLKSGKIEKSQPLNRFDYGNSVAFCHDIYDPYPDIYSECDVIYCEPPWQAGAKVFDERLGIVGRRFETLTRRISELILSVDIPVIITCGRWGQKLLPPATDMRKTFIDGPLGDCYIYSYRTPLPPFAEGEGVLPEIVKNYNVIGDWFCGYGNTALAAKTAGKRFIVSDYDPRCIGYMAETLK